MARPREFDETAVLNAAVQRFWAYGYEATSIRDLAEHMGLTGASLYNAFGDKRALYRKSLDHYLDQSVRERITRLENTLPPREAIGAFLEEIIVRSTTDRQRRGCMLVNSALELAPHDPSFRRIVDRAFSEIETFFRRCITKGQRDGSITRGSPEDLSRLLLGVLLGIRVLARTSSNEEFLRGVARPALALLAPPKPSARSSRRRLS
jgi:TetR/AcrR family transcriptional repressor of nem operon